jgi:hypothetical protein
MAPKKSGLANPLEPIGGKLLEAYPEIMQKFIKAGGKSINLCYKALDWVGMSLTCAQ